MSEPSPPTVLIIDEDVGFVWWLGEIFNEAGYRSVPALDSRRASALVNKLNLAVDLIVVSPDVQGVSSLIQTITRQRIAKIVLIQTPGATPPSELQFHAMLERPAGGEPVSRPDWLRKVRGVLRQVGVRAAG